MCMGKQPLMSGEERRGWDGETSKLSHGNQVVQTWRQQEAGDLHGGYDGNVKQRPQFLVILYI